MSAHLSNRPRKDGQISIQVKWKGRDTRRWHGHTFEGVDADRAVEFKRAVEAAGDRWPRGWIDGKGWARELPDVRTVDDVFEEWVRYKGTHMAKGRLKASGLAKYERAYERRRSLLIRLRALLVRERVQDAFAPPVLSKRR